MAFVYLKYSTVNNSKIKLAKVVPKILYYIKINAYK